ncbi:hypothetical protein SLEP1_g38992 [Rubroshorea leprosula]|uniref:RRM domain-containing protein n=1 Tax=Rubroshorea leprosula TaxID=152421 RepID=A0AAV5KZ67_9ROSI|nr:hypothetical protein SLEP1_g38992 [Rubroshorea leprosula]
MSRGFDWATYNQATVFYFSNFPEDWTYEQMWKTFLKFGRVYAIYSPRRKNRAGSRFGFVRFLDVKDVRKLENELDQIWIQDRKLRVNCPRFKKNPDTVADEVNRRNVQMQRRGSIYPEAMRVKGRSYADVVTGHNGRNARMQMNETNRGVKQIWKAKTSEQNWTGLEFNPKHENWKWLEGCYLGTARSVEIVPVIQERLYMEGLFVVRVRAMGGKLVLLDGEDKEELKELVESAADWLGQWFDEIRPWSPTLVASERFVWVKMMGVPLEVWGADFFSTLASLWGKFISLDESTSSMKRFDVARVLVSTAQMNPISRTLRIKVNGQLVCIMCREEDGSNGHFHLKTDHNPVLQSDSEDEELEYWSTDHYPEEEFGGNSHNFQRSMWSEDGNSGEEG